MARKHKHRETEGDNDDIKIEHHVGRTHTSIFGALARESVDRLRSAVCHLFPRPEREAPRRVSDGSNERLETVRVDLRDVGV